MCTAREKKKVQAVNLLEENGFLKTNPPHLIFTNNGIHLKYLYLYCTLHPSSQTNL